MNSDNGVTKETLDKMRLEALQNRAKQLQEAIDSLRPQDTVLRKRYQEFLEMANKEIEELKGRGL